MAAVCAVVLNTYFIVFFFVFYTLIIREEIDKIMKRAYLNYFLLGIFIFLLLAGVSSYPVNAEASPLIKMNPG